MRRDGLYLRQVDLDNTLLHFSFGLVTFDFHGKRDDPVQPAIRHLGAEEVFFFFLLFVFAFGLKRQTVTGDGDFEVVFLDAGDFSPDDNGVLLVQDIDLRPDFKSLVELGPERTSPGVGLRKAFLPAAWDVVSEELLHAVGERPLASPANFAFLLRQDVPYFGHFAHLLSRQTSGTGTRHLYMYACEGRVAIRRSTNCRAFARGVI